jgi:hypothetical protein
MPIDENKVVLGVFLLGLAAFCIISALVVKSFRNRFTGGPYPTWLVRILVLFSGAVLLIAAIKMFIEA